MLHVQLRCGSLSITTPVSDQANEFNVRSKLHGQVSLAAVNQILCSSYGYERFQNSKDSLKACLENVNIYVWNLCQCLGRNSYSRDTLNEMKTLITKIKISSPYKG